MGAELPMARVGASAPSELFVLKFLPLKLYIFLILPPLDYPYKRPFENFVL